MVQCPIMIDDSATTEAPCRQRVAAETPRAESGSPSAVNGDGVECSKCGHVGEPIGKGQCAVCGVFMKANVAGMVHGGRSTALRRRIESEAAEALAERRQAILEDLGGEEQLSTIAADTVERYVVGEAMLTWMESNLLAEGVITAKGKRRAMHSAYLQQLDRVARLGALLGLEREPREVY